LRSLIGQAQVLPLDADFTSNVTLGTPPLTVQFYDASGGNPSAWSWVFEMYPDVRLLDDAEATQAIPYYGNEFSAERNPVVTYTRPGNYTVSLTVSRTGETDMITKEEYIHVIPPPPDVDFSAWPEEGEAPLEVEFWENVPYAYYYDEYLWDFGDGTTGTGTWLYHTYENPGLYNVTLTVNSSYGSGSLTKVDFINVTQSRPVPDFEGSPLSGNAPLEVVFTDTSTGTVTSRYWNFGEGPVVWANDTPEISHTYVLPGTYTVALTVGNTAGNVSVIRIGYVQVNPSGTPPVARFTVLPAIGYVPMTVRFTDRSMGTPIKWQWDFGDGNSSSEQNPQHTYTTGGRYRATLTVFNSGGSSSYSSYIWARPGRIISPLPTTTPGPVFPPIREHSPVAVFRMNQSFGSAPMSVQFTDLSFNNPTSWLWQFGDGETSTLKDPVHTFTESGTYSVSLTVENDIGASTTSRRIYVR
jgi:PKD repeat protein